MPEKHKHNNPERMKVVRGAIDELRELKAAGEFHPTADIDMVWVLSNPGTVLKPSEDGIYKGEMNDLRAVLQGVDIIRRVTALRLSKDLNLVTPEDVAEAGPVLYYNGEDEHTEGMNYEQNKDLLKLLNHVDSPIPMSKVVIGHIDRIGTPAQVEDIAGYLREHPVGGKIAVVTSAEHSARVGRYIEHYKNLLPPETIMVNAPFSEVSNQVGKTLREIRKVGDYYEKGDLAANSYFSSPEDNQVSQ
jgi:hypothetical protein